MAMRRYPVVPFDAEKLEGFLAGREVTSAELLRGGACNSNYLVQLGEEAPVVARFYQRGSPEQDQRIFQLVAALVPVPEILAAGEDWAVFRFVRGKRLSSKEAAVRDAGRVLARIGSFGFEYPGQITGGEETEPWPFDGCAGLVDVCLCEWEVRRWLGPDGLRSVAGLVAAESSRLAEIDAEAQLVHGDFNPSNILTEAGGVTGVIDWEFAHAGSPYMDMGNLLRHLPAAAPALAKGLLDEGRSLPGDWEYRAALVDLTSNLEFLNSTMPAKFKRACVERIRNLVQY
jgi:aminoglycoside phosphotransferase (APT) family kinase protein